MGRRTGCWLTALICALPLAAQVELGPGTAAAAEPPAQRHGLPLVAPLTDEARIQLPPFAAEIPSPQAFLGYSIGARFTRHADILGYLAALDAAAERVVSWEYGRTYQDRPLRLLAISSPRNLARLEELRQRQLRLANDVQITGAELDELAAAAPAIVWLAYGVHGNESSSAEVAMAVAYTLAAGGGEIESWLENTVVLLDPLVNPDGRERYVNGFLDARGRLPNPDRDAIEHQEAWPGGRVNHYLIDLNRDWAWATQRETQDRLAAYRQWEPHVYVDFHEMSGDSSYFFPPAAPPILPVIDQRTLSWLETFGRANAQAFDRQGWFYYKGERFDLFYPGYGDSYPALRGAVGMTYEVAGGGLGGQTLEKVSGELLTLADRVARHFTTSLATIATAANGRRQLVADFAAVRRRALGEAVHSFLWQADAPEAISLASLLARHGVTLSRLAAATEVAVRKDSRAQLEPRTFPAGTFVVSTAQPLGPLVRTLLESDVPLPTEFLSRQRQRLERHQATEFYDVTAWSLPLALGLECWTADGELLLATGTAEPFLEAGLRRHGSLGWLLPPRGLASYQLAARLQNLGLHFRMALSDLELGQERFPPGTLFVPTAGNPPELGRTLDQLTKDLGLVAFGTSTGFTQAGISLGSDDFVEIRPARIGLVGGRGTKAGSHGSLWFLLDQLLEADFLRLSSDQLAEARLSDLDVVLLPDGEDLGKALGTAGKEALQAWVKAGGLLIAQGGHVPWLGEAGLSTVRVWKREAGNDADPESEVAKTSGPLDGPLETPGAILATHLSEGHPLVAGLLAPPAVLVQGEQVLLPSGDPRRDLLTAVAERPVLAGFAWDEAQARLAGSLLVGIEEKEQGRVVIFAQDPVFRLFWRSTLPLLLNATLYGPSLHDAGALR